MTAGNCIKCKKSIHKDPDNLALVQHHVCTECGGVAALDDFRNICHSVWNVVKAVLGIALLYGLVYLLRRHRG